MSRSLLTLNAVELLRQPGTRRAIDVGVGLDAIDVHDDRLEGDVEVAVVAESTLDDIVVAGTLTVGWHDSCRRCLRPVSGPLVVGVEERYAIPGDTVDPEAFPIHNGQLDLTPMVRESVLLAAPDAPLCREDCAGLCPTCGVDRNDVPCGCQTTVRDERWAVLDQLQLDE